MSHSKVENTKVFVHYVGVWLQYYDQNGTEKYQVKCVVVDQAKGPLLLWGYDRASQEQYLQVGNSLKLKNCILRKDGLVVTQYSKIMM